MTTSDIDPAVDDIVANPPWNPRPVERPAIRELLRRALDGDLPQHREST
jgi:maleylacetate reductase